MRRLLRSLAAVLVGCSLWLSPAAAQGPNPPVPGEAEEKPVRVPALQYTVAILLTMLILFIVCMPSRKGVQD